jgi:hypothetical protein
MGMRNVMSAAEQEHWDHVAGSASELQNCFEEAQGRRRQLHSQNAERIARVRGFQMFAVVEEVPYYCKATDAFAGSYQIFRVGFKTREAADAYMEHMFKRGDMDPESRFIVLEPVMSDTIKIRKTWGTLRPVQKVKQSSKNYERQQAKRELRQLWASRPCDL